MEKNFEEAFQHVVFWETPKYTNDPNDPGGATKYGITLRTLKSWRGIDTTPEDVRNLTEEEAKNIYRERYWFTCSCQHFPFSTGFALFDCAVNQGPNTASRLIQKTLKVSVDGIIGPKTLSAVGRFEEDRILRDFMSHRALHYSSLAKVKLYGLGWYRRLFDTHQKAYDLIEKGD